MKIGIVTFHRAHNYGAVLQCFALKTVLIEMGHDVHVIDHRNSAIENVYALYPKRDTRDEAISVIQYLKSKISFYLTYSSRKKRFQVFEHFINNYLLEETDRKICDIWDGFDCIVWGSDQIWKYDIIKDDKCFWGQIDNKVVRKITYAASAGKLDDHFKENIHLLKQFDKISVREKDLHSYLYKNNIHTDVVLDPTLLLNKKDWSKNLPLSIPDNKPYICVYAMRNRAKVMETANKISAMEGLPIKEIHKIITPRNIFKKYKDASPIDFVSLINNSKYVVTDSFHGTAFSIILNKQFVTIRLNDGHDNRSESLLTSAGIPERMSDAGENYNDPIDYIEVNDNIRDLRNKSIDFLKRNIY